MFHILEPTYTFQVSNTFLSFTKPVGSGTVAWGLRGEGLWMSFVPWSVFQLKTGKKSKTCEAGWTQSTDATVELWARWPRSTGSGVFNSNSEGSKQGGYPEASETWAELEVHWSWSSREGVPSEEEPVLGSRTEPVEPAAAHCALGVHGECQCWCGLPKRGGGPSWRACAPERSLRFLVCLFIICLLYWSIIDL